MIRKATERDIPQLLGIGYKMHQESRHYWRTVDDEVASWFVLTFISSPDCYFTVAEVEGRVVGFLAGGVTGVWYSTAKIAQEVCLYVEPESRGSMAGVRLIKDFMEWAKSKGADEVVIENDAAVPNTPIDQLLPRMGMERVGSIYSMRLNRGD